MGERKEIKKNIKICQSVWEASRVRNGFLPSHVGLMVKREKRKGGGGVWN